jgi:hypothetical protein
MAEILPLVLSVGATLAGITSLSSEWFQGSSLIGFASQPAAVDQLQSAALRAIPLVMMALSVLFAGVAAKKSFSAPGSGMLWLILTIVAVGAAFLSFFNAITPGGLFGAAGAADAAAPAGAAAQAPGGGPGGRGLRDAHEAVYRILKKTAKPLDANGINAAISGKGGANVICAGEIAAVFQVILCVLAIGCGFGRAKTV